MAGQPLPINVDRELVAAPVAPRDRKGLEGIARLAIWVGALEVDDEYTMTLEQLERLARLLKVAA